MTQEQMIQCMYYDMQEMKQDVKELKEDVSVLKEDVSVLKEDVSVLKKDVSGLKEDVCSLQKDMEDVQYRVKGIELTLENTTNRNICIIAEGHLDLSRKLSEALKVENEKEMFVLRVNKLEDDVRRLKHKVGIA